jgi:nitrogen-specific signal transduction histidine kinase
MEVTILRLLGAKRVDAAPRPSIADVIGQAHFVLGPVTRGIADALHRELEARSVRLARRQGAMLLLAVGLPFWLCLATLRPMAREVAAMEAALERREGEAEEREARVLGALARAAHEIRATLSGITGVTRLLGRSALDDEQRRQVRLME